MLLRLTYLGITNAFALLRLLPGGDRDKDIEILFPVVRKETIRVGDKIAENLPRYRLTPPL
jgi:hypothetical protein